MPVMVLLHNKSQSVCGQPPMHTLLGHLIWRAVLHSCGGSPHSPELSYLLPSNCHKTSGVLQTSPLTCVMELKWAQTEMQEVSLEMRNGFFIVKVTEHWHRFPSQWSDGLCIFKRYSKANSTQSWKIISGWPCLSMGACTRWPPEVHSLETVLGFWKSFKSYQQDRLTGRHVIPLSNSMPCFHMVSEIET